MYVEEGGTVALNGMLHGANEGAPLPPDLAALVAPVVHTATAVMGSADIWSVSGYKNNLSWAVKNRTSNS